MDENLVGYLMNALDPATHRQVEDYLRDNPDGRRRAELLRQALAPLEADADPIEPPPGLAVRTLACVAEYCCRDFPQAPSVRWSDAPRRRWWRRADVLVAAGLLVTVSLLLPPVVRHLQRQHELESCKNNLGEFGRGLLRYSQEHRKAFPNVADPRLPRHVAGMALPVLFDARAMRPEAVSVRCPGNGDPTLCPMTLGQLQGLSDEEFRQVAPRLLGCYAYSLGYKENDEVRGYSSDSSAVPIMADRPPFRASDPCTRTGNSPNHGGLGQNVLFTDGHVAFLKDRVLAGDDIFLARDQRLGAGVDRDDIVLGPSDAQP